jgi:LmbE family N-acetylglucosaminyl deacetylase
MRPRHQTPETLAEFSALLAGREGADGSAIMTVVAHPDDETIGIGGHLAGLRACRIVHVTDGAPRDLADAHAHGFESRQVYADARRGELMDALATAGISPLCLTALGYPDKEATTNLVMLAQELACLLSDPNIRFVCTHPFEGGHPDHDATAFAVHAACHLLRRDRRPAPTIIEMAFYSAGPDGPVFQDFVRGTGSESIEVRLTQASFRQKQRMLASHLSQQRTLAPFSSRTERFRLAPDYDFLALPNNGRLYYESLSLGFDPRTWLRATAFAQQALRLDQP